MNNSSNTTTETNSVMVVKSGNCILCETGILTDLVSFYGEEPIHTGDLVILWHSFYYEGLEREWYPADHPLSVVVCNKYETYSDGSLELLDYKNEFYPMFIKGAHLSEDWRFQVVKKYDKVVDGEYWSSYRNAESVFASINLNELKSRISRYGVIPF